MGEEKYFVFSFCWMRYHANPLGVCPVARHYDILVIVKENLAIKEKMSLSGMVRRKLAKMGIDADIIIKSKDEVDYYKDKIGSVVKSALSEGVAL